MRWTTLVIVFTYAVITADYLPASDGSNTLSKPNVLIVTVDDMSADSLGVYGCQLAGTSPSIDAFAKTAMRFEHAHVQVGNCMPGRNIMWSGIYSHLNGVEGFVQNLTPDYPVLCDLAQEAGYFTAIRGKVAHSTPYSPYTWDAVLDLDTEGNKYHTKDPKSYGDSTRQGISLAKKAGKPFCLMVNISDPHKPFYKPGERDGKPIDLFLPTRVFTSEEVPVPGFLFEDQIVRQELSLYYSSVRRADDAFRAIHDALNESGEAERTVVFFCSDHGMPLPFAKTQLYYHSTHTPLMIRWPGVTSPGYVDEKHMVSSIDFLPTLLEIIDQIHPEPDRLQGRSFGSILKGEEQEGRDHIVLQYNENSGGNRHPMRGVLTKDYLYLINPWSDGNRKFATATTGTATYRRMVELAAVDSEVSRRLKHFDHRELEELYALKDDQECLVNLIGYTEHQGQTQVMRELLERELTRLKDPVASLVIGNQRDMLIHEFMLDQDAYSDRIRNRRRQGRSDMKPLGTQLPREALVMRPNLQVHRGQECKIEVSYDLPKKIGTQLLQITLKRVANLDSARLPERIERKTVEIFGSGTISVSFLVPEDLDVDQVRFAAFVGENYEKNLIHQNSASIEIKN